LVHVQGDFSYLEELQEVHADLVPARFTTVEKFMESTVGYSWSTFKTGDTSFQGA
jgi:hypothetical protein